MAQRLARELGLGVGVSSGANLLGALKVQQSLEHSVGEHAVVCTVLCDDNKKYLTTDLCREEPVRPGYLSSKVELIGFDTIACPGL